MAERTAPARLHRPGRSTGGFVLAAVLLLLLALTLLVHGGLALLRVEDRAGRVGVLVLRARILAEGAVREVGALPLPESASPRATTGLPEARPEPDARVTVFLHGVGREWILAEARARVGRGSLVARRAVGRVHWRLDPVSRLAATEAAVTSPSPPAGPGAVEGVVASEPAGWPRGACAGFRSAVDSLFPGGTLPAWRRLPPEAPAPRSGPGGPTDAVPGLGLLDGGALWRRATVRPPARLTPGPVVRLGACDGRDPANWGAPSDPLGPCGGRHVLGVAPGPFLVEGGEGQGVLAAAGPLTLKGHRFVGVVLVGGDLHLRDGAEIVGLVRSRGAVSVDAGARIAASGCAVLRALSSPSLRPAFGVPVALPGGPWIPLP